jgi:hypothetical protein
MLSEIKKHYWLLPLTGGILSIIGFLFPAWYSPPIWVEYIWIIGIIYHVNGGDVLDILPYEMFIPSLIAAIAISLSSIIIIIFAFYTFRSKKISINVENLWLIMVIIETAISIFYIIGIQIGFFLHANQNFWDIYQIQFGLITPFIGASLTLIGTIIGKRLKRDI